MTRRSLTAARVYRGLTQDQLALKVGKSQPWVSLVESGRLIPDRSMAMLIGTLLEVDYATVFTDPPAGENSDQPLILA